MIKITKAFKYAYGGTRVVEFEEGHEFPDGEEAGELALEEGWGERVADAAPETFPQKIENGLYRLSDGTEFRGNKKLAGEAEAALAAGDKIGPASANLPARSRGSASAEAGASADREG